MGVRVFVPTAVTNARSSSKLKNVAYSQRCRERLSPSHRWAAMQYHELLARRIVAEVARSSVDGGALQPVMLHEVARRLKIDEASAEAAMYRAIAERWLNVEGTSLYRIRLTAAGQALSPRR